MTKASRLGEAVTEGLSVPPFVVIEAAIADSEISAQLKKMLTQAGLLEIDLFSVRSSANVEDGTGLSFAGQFETFLSVKKADLVEAIIACRASATSPAVQSYTGKLQPLIIMEVIVQEMIEADV